MHDLHAADQILKTALDYAAKNNLKKITKLTIGLGNFEEHGQILEPDNLKFNLNLLSCNTIAQKAQIVIEKIADRAYELKNIEGIR